ncbi:DUF6339 family protein [Cellulosimicrobium sp. NPDC057127]|uniref:DUF6339 family protein n=1 Tax=Cellulosimicrobium sp. NPDC057127 TaxID=3346026 RepID=UPI00363E26E0
MSTLYPRLLRARVDALFDEYANSTSLKELASRASAHDDAAVYVATGGSRVRPERLADLATSVRDLAGQHGYPQPPHRAPEFDVALSRLLHGTMNVAAAEAASREMWAFLSLVLLPDVAYWRFPNPPGDRVKNTDITRHVFGRLWWRAELVHDAALEDPYQFLTILGEADFDHVYARRAQIGASPKIVRNLLIVWSDLREAGQLDALNEREAFRSMLVLLRRIVPFLSLNALSDGALHDELDRTARQAIMALRGEGPA